MNRDKRRKKELRPQVDQLEAMTLLSADPATVLTQSVPPPQVIEQARFVQARNNANVDSVDVFADGRRATLRMNFQAGGYAFNTLYRGVSRPGGVNLPGSVAAFNQLAQQRVAAIQQHLDTQGAFGTTRLAAAATTFNQGAVPLSPTTTESIRTVGNRTIYTLTDRGPNGSQVFRMAIRERPGVIPANAPVNAADAAAFFGHRLQRQANRNFGAPEVVLATPRAARSLATGAAIGAGARGGRAAQAAFATNPALLSGAGFGGIGAVGALPAQMTPAISSIAPGFLTPGAVPALGAFGPFTGVVPNAVTGVGAGLVNAGIPPAFGGLTGFGPGIDPFGVGIGLGNFGNVPLGTGVTSTGLLFGPNAGQNTLNLGGGLGFAGAGFGNPGFGTGFGGTGIASPSFGVGAVPNSGFTGVGLGLPLGFTGGVF